MSTSTSNQLLAVLDTNVLVYAHDVTSPYHEACSRLLGAAQQTNARLCLTPQTLAEFFAVVTSPKRVTTPRTPREATDAIEALLSRPGVSLLHIPPAVVARWIELVRTHPVSRQRIYDLQLAATMFGNGITRLYTYNDRDFEGIAGLELLVP